MTGMVQNNASVYQLFHGTGIFIAMFGDFCQLFLI